MKQSKKIGHCRHSGFTLIELLVSISILATISIVWYVSYAGHMKNSYNTTRIETIDSLHLSLSDYFQLKKTLPDPHSNYVAYDERGTYMHSLSGAYGVSGYVSDDFLPRGYVNFTAVDPESKQFYGYGKLTNNTAFDLAATLYDDVTGGYKTYLRGTYQKQRLASLIRSYSSSNFVSQDSREDLPYNPYERKVTAYVSSSSGTVTLKNSTGNALSLTGELNSGDTITVAAGATALLHISDGSELSLGSTTSQTELALSSLAYTDDNNLVSKVALFLKSGEVWTEAPHLRSETDSASDFSVHTDTAVAAVRGTVFGMTKSITGSTSISLASGKLEVTSIATDANGNILSQQAFTASNGFSTTATGWFVLDSSKSYMIVPDGGQPITLNNITNTATSPTSTGSLAPSDVNGKIQHPPFSLGYRPKADKISFTGATNTAGAHTATGILSVTFQNPGADSYYLSFGTGEIDTNKPFPNPDPNPFYTGTLSTTGTVTITGAFAYILDPQISRTYALRVCLHGQCSAPDIKTLGGDTFSFDSFRVWGEEKQGTAMASIITPVATPTCSTTDPTQKGFWDSTCLTGTNSGLVAYAPYDGTTTNIYYTGAQLLTGVWNSLEDVTYRPYDITGNKFTDSVSWSSTIPSYYATIGLSKLTQPGSMYQWGTTKGILLDNNNSTDGTTTLNDSLKYDLTPFALGNNFAIEMSVRGGALKRASGWYALFDIPWTDGFRLSMYNGNLVLWTSALKDIVGIAAWSLNTYITDTNKFYRVVASYGNWTPKIEIYDGGNKILWGVNASTIPWITNTWGSITPGVLSSLYVWSRYNSTAQWNDIVGSVKIYKY